LTDRRGFTLVEVVLSMAIVAMVVAAVFAVLRLAHRAERKGVGRSESSQRVMVLADRLSWLLAGTFPYKQFDPEEETERIFFDGEADSLAFVTTSVDRYSDDAADRPGLKYVRLSLGPGGLRADERVFYMKDAVLREYVLEPGAVSLEIEYMEQDRETGETGWVGNWDPRSRDYIPVAVSLRVVLDLDGQEVEVPPLIVRLPAGGSRGAAVPLPKLP
jgi:prepilin-type N-terminal cleavage/methylation domain-containing protein